MSRTLIVGKSGMGKTTFMVNDLLLPVLKGQKKKFDLILCSPTATLQKQYKPILKYVRWYFKSINEDVAFEIMHRVQANLKRKNKKQVIIVWDDLGENTYLKRKQKGNTLNELVIGAKHYNVHIFHLIQKIHHETTTYRINVDKVYLFKLLNNEQKALAWKYWGGYKDKEAFFQMCHVAWKDDWGFLEIDMTNPKDVVFRTRNNKVFKND